MKPEYIEENHPAIQVPLAIMVTGWIAAAIMGIGDIFIDYGVDHLYRNVLGLPLLAVGFLTLGGTPQVKIPIDEYNNRDDDRAFKRLFIFGACFWIVMIFLMFSWPQH